MDVSKAVPRANTTGIWWSNAVFFVSVHIASLIGIYYRPPSVVPRATLLVSLFLWQAAEFGITIGYHRLYAHRAFRAGLPIKLVLAVLGSSAFQGSIKWWSLRHRLHHRFTDDPHHDPYAATRGLFYSHMGWIFFKPRYDRMSLVNRDDLESDPIVRFQHKYYVSLALTFGFVAPTLMGYLWGDPLGSFIWGGLVTKVAVWHCTFLVNSLAHWDGLQPYSDENTSRGNLVLALLTSGEGNHNFHHAFPHDYRSGPSILEWDPSKWMILALHYFGLAGGLRRAREEDMKEAKFYMHHKHADGTVEDNHEPWAGLDWKLDDLREYLLQNPRKCVVVVGGFVVDVSAYLGEHPGGAAVLRAYAVPARGLSPECEKWRDATWAFAGGLNNHSRAAKRILGENRIARLID